MTMLVLCGNPGSTDTAGSRSKFRSAIGSARSGCYEALLAPVPVKTMEGNCYLIERFDPVSTDVGGAAITQHFLDREASHLPSEKIQLNLLGEFEPAFR